MFTKVQHWLQQRKDKKRKDTYLKQHGCDSCCPECKVWESDGNDIVTVCQDDGSDVRTCGLCSYTWRAIFTPAGFIPIDIPKKEN
jgi:hypothetical protein